MSDTSAYLDQVFQKVDRLTKTGKLNSNAVRQLNAYLSSPEIWEDEQKIFVSFVTFLILRTNWLVFTVPGFGRKKAESYLNNEIADVRLKLVRSRLKDMFKQERVKEEVVQILNELFPIGRFGYPEALYRGLKKSTKLEDFLAKTAPSKDYTGLPVDFQKAAKFGKDLFLSKIVKLEPRLIGSIRDIYQEYMLWLKKHNDMVADVSWEAFEKIVAEVFASYGFVVEITSRLRNKSADIIAVKCDKVGVDHKYLIECKKYRRDRRIGMHVINQVIGAARRADVDHAFLFTTSFFTKDVNRRKAEFSDIRLHLRDGTEVCEWLKNYEPKSDGGLWLSQGWNDKA